ncbi:MAG TPA: hypothetical protein VMR28_01515 [Candidatus Saccharimonadales bacterium]|nr:hypothetical protein [Candidatus Saccharimonadales bacterium]
MKAHVISHWHKTKIGLVIFALIEMAIAYGFASLAIDRGNLWWYLLTLLFFIGSLQNIARLIGAVIHDYKATKA